MKKTLLLFLSCTILVSCNNSGVDKNAVAVKGTWKLIRGMLIEHGDTLVTDYTGNVSFIKIINDDHFAFLQHDLNQGKDSLAVFAAGGGKYTLNDSIYTEHLEYCSDRAWEQHDFTFTVNIRNDTLTQTGTEVIEDQGINRLNVEIYRKIK